mmetsp:Transcript_19659/g.59532  ORF Transcript_19659/g.59532 Transcript_19659/m.59532 type:complete len:128 (-) Transcript_19659:222-605(-)
MRIHLFTHPLACRPFLGKAPSPRPPLIPLAPSPLPEYAHTQFYNSFPEYNQLLTERMHDNGQCDVELAVEDTLDLKETNRKALANACLAALKLGNAPDFGVLSTEGIIEDGPWPNSDGYVSMLKSMA